MAGSRTPGRTPGRTREGNEKYIMFNEDPRHRGTQSGRPMPTDIPLNDDGFEDPSAFMRSPTASLTGSTSRRTTMGGMSVAPSSVGTTRRQTLGRMSQLDASDDEDNGLRMDDDIGDVTFFGNSHPANVPLPRRSQLGPATPTTQYDDLPSPSVSKSASRRKSTLAGSPRTARRLTSGTNLQSPLADDDLADDSLLLADDDDTGLRGTPSASPRNRKSTTRRSDVDDDEDVGEADESTDTVKHRNRKSSAGRSTNLEDEEAEDFYDATGDLGIDDQGLDYDGDNGDDGDLNGDEVEDDDENQALDDMQDGDDEDDPAPHSDESGEETAVERPTAKVAKRKTKTAQRGRPRQTTAERQMPPPRSTRISNIGPANKDTQYKGDFRTSSGRRHMAPLNWWDGDRVVYKRGRHLAEIAEVVRAPHEEPLPLGRRKNARGRGRSSAKSKTRSPDPDGIDDGVGCDDETNTKGIVAEFKRNQTLGPNGEPEELEEVESLVAMPRYKLDPHKVEAKLRKDGSNREEIKHDEFYYQKVFGEKTFTAAGVIRISVGKRKPVKTSKDNAFSFFVHKGGLEVTVHRSQFTVGPGGMFFVPRGNRYGFSNISEVEAEVFFSQSREILHDHEMDTASNAENKETPAPPTVKKRRSIEPAESDATPQVKKKPGRPKKQF